VNLLSDFKTTTSYDDNNGLERISDGHLILLLHSQGDSVINGIFTSNIEIVEAENSTQGIALCYGLNLDAVFIHTSLIDLEGLHAFTEIIELCENNYIPILALTPSIEIDFYKKYAFAEDIITSPIDSFTFTGELLKHLEKRKKIMNQILIDPMTGTKNQIFLEQEVEKQLNEMKRSHDSFSLVYIELDGLQGIRETYGYKIGSEMMKELADFFKQSLRPADSIGRYREGFVLVLPKTYKEDALKLLGRLMPKFSQITFYAAEGELIATFSAKVLDFIDSSQTAYQCLSLMPFLIEEMDEDKKELLIDGRERDTTNILRKLKIGIIDDDRIIRELLKLQLDDIGEKEFEIEVKGFADGEEFFNDPWHRQSERFLLIIDRIMPKMDGLEVLQKIRTQYDRRRYLCIMLTSRDSESEIALAIQRGANDYLIKPFSLKELRARIKRLLRGSR
jgi:two-component system cell cycle response regulator